MDSMHDLKNDTTLLECHLDDQMWGFTIRMVEETFDKNVKQSDRVLHCLCNIGLYDWNSFDVQGLEGIWSMRYSAVMGHRLFKMIGDKQTKVRFA